MKKTALLITFFFLINYAVLAQKPKAWLQRGAILKGKVVDDRFGRSVSLSSDGNVLAASTPFNGGEVRIYSWDNTNQSWSQRGSTLKGIKAGDYFGSALSLSGDGNTIAIAADAKSSDSVLYAGAVTIYSWNGSTWQKLGNDIFGEEENDRFGRSVSISSDGQIVAIGSAWHGDKRGHVKIYIWDIKSASWVQRGLNINGEQIGDLCGLSVSLSKIGDVVAIGSPYSAVKGNYSGQTRIFAWDKKVSAWKQRGLNLNGDTMHDFFGYAVSLSNDGKVLAVGSPGNGTISTGYSKIYSWDSVSSKWTMRGGKIDQGCLGGGTFISTSADGAIVAIGNPEANLINVYKWSGSKWDKLSNTIDGFEVEEEGQYAGFSVSISADGYKLAFGAPTKIGDNGGFGYASVHEWKECVLAITNEPSDTTTVAGNKVTLSFSTNNAKSKAQWQTKSGSEWKNILDTGQFTGTLTKDLSISTLTAVNNNSFFRVITSISGCSDTSRSVLVLVKCNLKIISQPLDKWVLPDSSALFYLNANSATAKIQWQINNGFGWSNLKNSSQYDGVSNDTLFIRNNLSQNNNNEFRAIISEYGCSDTSKVAKLKVVSNSLNEFLNDSFLVYPNPTSRYLNIQTIRGLKGIITISDISGKVLKIYSSNEKLIDVTFLMPGTYNVSFCNEKKHITKRIIIK